MDKKLLIACVCITTAFAWLGCGPSDDGEGNNGEEGGTTREKMTDGYTYYVEYQPTPDPIPHNELFTIDVSVWETEAKDTPLTDAAIAVDATMPAHGHGMNTEPTITDNEDGTFTVEGMKFHMESPTPEEKWVIGVEVTQGETTETASFDVMCCDEQ